MPLRGKLLLIVEVDIPPEYEADFNEWYSEVHLPDLLRVPGFHSARRYVKREGSPKYVAVYEIESDEAFQHPEFARVRGWGPFASHVTNIRRTLAEALDS